MDLSRTANVSAWNAATSRAGRGLVVLASWDIDDGHNPVYRLKCAEILAALVE